MSTDSSPSRADLPDGRLLKQVSLLKRLLLRARMLRRLLRYARLQYQLSELFLTQSLITFTKLGIADRLGDGAASASALAAALALDAEVLDDLLRLQVKLRIVTRERDGRYRLTALGRHLRSDTPETLRGTVTSMGDLVLPAWGHLEHSVRTRQAGFNLVFGTDFYSHMARDPEAKAQFNAWMAETTREWILPFLDLFDLTQTRSFVDIGGNTGLLATLLMQRYPHLHGTVFDQPYPAAQAEQRLAEAGLLARGRFLAGDFFASVPGGADLYILSRVLDNWDDEHAARILANCRAAMAERASLIIIDTVAPDGGGNRFSLLAKLHVRVMGSGQERTQAQYRAMLAQAGFGSPRFVPTGGIITFIEAGIR